MKINCYLRASGGCLQSKGLVYPAVVDAGKIESQEFVALVEKNCNIGSNMVKAVLDGVAKEMKKNVALGHTVEIPELGIFSLEVKGKVAKTAAGVNVIKDGKAMMSFTPNITIRRTLDNVDFEVVNDRVRSSNSLTDDEAYEAASRLLEEKGFFMRHHFAELTSVSDAYATKVLTRLVAQGKIGVDRSGRTKIYHKAQVEVAEDLSGDNDA